MKSETGAASYADLALRAASLGMDARVPFGSDEGLPRPAEVEGGRLSTISPEGRGSPIPLPSARDVAGLHPRVVALGLSRSTDESRLSPLQKTRSARSSDLLHSALLHAGRSSSQLLLAFLAASRCLEVRCMVEAKGAEVRRGSAVSPARLELRVHGLLDRGLLLLLVLCGAAAASKQKPSESRGASTEIRARAQT